MNKNFIYVMVGLLLGIALVTMPGNARGVWRRALAVGGAGFVTFSSAAGIKMSHFIASKSSFEIREVPGMPTTVPERSL